MFLLVYRKSVSVNGTDTTYVSRTEAKKSRASWRLNTLISFVCVLVGEKWPHTSSSGHTRKSVMDGVLKFKRFRGTYLINTLKQVSIISLILINSFALNIAFNL